MKIPNPLKISRKSLFNPKAWFGAEELKAQHQVIGESFRAVFTKETATHEETFDEAVQRLGLTKADLKRQITVSGWYVFTFFMCGLLIFFYAFYLLFRYKHILPWLMGLSASAVLFAQAFKFHFWIVQMRKRKLGMPFSAWLSYVLGSQRKST